MFVHRSDKTFKTFIGGTIFSGVAILGPLLHIVWCWQSSWLPQRGAHDWGISNLTGSQETDNCQHLTSLWPVKIGRHAESLGI